MSATLPPGACACALGMKSCPLSSNGYGALKRAGGRTSTHFGDSSTGMSGSTATSFGLGTVTSTRVKPRLSSPARTSDFTA